MFCKERIARGMVAGLVFAFVLYSGCLSAEAKMAQVAVYKPQAAGRIAADGVYEVLKEAEGIEPVYIYDFNASTLAKFDVLVLCQMRYPKDLPSDWMDTVRGWVREGHGLLVTHDAVGYRSHKPFFPQISEGTGNAYYNREPYSKECSIARTHPITEGFKPKERFFLSYYDYITIDPGKEGIVVVRGVEKTGETAVSSAPVVVCGEIGKGRYIANGAYLGGLAPSGKAVKPIRGEKKLLINSIVWLAGKGARVSSEQSEDIGNGTYLGTKEANLARNGSAEEADASGKRPLGWGLYTSCGKSKWGITEKEAHKGKRSAYLKISGYHPSKRTTLDGKEYTQNRVGAALMQGETGGYTGGKAYEVFPASKYKVTFWIKGDKENKKQPNIGVSMWTWATDKGDSASRKVITPSERIQVTSSWQRHEREFRPTSAKRMAIGLGMGRTDKDLPLGTTIYVDDVIIRKEKVTGLVSLEGISIDSILKDCEEKIEVKWKDTLKDKELEIEEAAPGTEIPLDKDKLTAPYYDPIPKEWDRIDLSGLWKIKKLPDTEKNPADDKGTKDGFFKEDYDDSSWKQRPVPSYWDNEDKPYPDGDVGHIQRKDFTGVGWYRYEFTVPEGYNVSDRHIILHFRGVDYETTVYINGEKVGCHTGGAHPFEFDVTKNLKYGQKNLLAVRVYDANDRYQTDFRNVSGGIYVKVFLENRPAIYAKQILLTPHLNNSELELDVFLMNSREKRQDIDLRATVEPWHGIRYFATGKGTTTKANLSTFKLTPGINEINCKMKLNNPVYWTPENPYLYVLVLHWGDKVIGKERFGFREFKQKGRFFYLNGKRIKLSGLVFNDRNLRGLKKILIDKKNSSVRRLMLAYKSWYVNTIYPQCMSATLPRHFYDVCDEVGMLIYEHFPYRWKELKNRKSIRQWFYNRYNHPSLALMALSAEVRLAKYKEILDPLYEYFKSIDKQKRPLCTTSGGRPSGVVYKTDICDNHAYPGAIGGHPLDMGDCMKKFNKDMWQFVGKNLPVLNWEMSGGGLLVVRGEERAARRALTEEPVNKDELITLIQGSDAAYRMPIGARWLSLYGIRRYVLEDYRKAANEGKPINVYYKRYQVKGQIEEYRRLGDLMQGAGMNMRPNHVFNLRRNGEIKGCSGTGLAEGILVTDPGYPTYKRCYNPRFVCLNIFDKNVFSGRKFKATVYGINDTANHGAGWSLRAVIRKQDGKRLNDRIADIGRVESFKRKLVAYEWDIPAETPTGFYRIELFLEENGKTISDNYYRFFVLNRDDLDPTISSGNKKVALYDVGEEYSGKGAITTRQVLDDLRMDYTRLQDFSDLGKYNVLVVGAHSADNKVGSAGDEIRMWLRNGGRLVQYEQRNPGKISYIPQMSIIKNYGGIVADMIEIDHSIFDKIRNCDNWDRWSGTLPEAASYGRCGGIFSALIGPLNQTMLATGCLSIPRGSDKAVQMLISEVKVGEGIALVSQAEATRRYNIDSVATKYLQNTLRYIISDEVTYAKPVSSLRITNIDYRRCGYIDLSEYLNLALGRQDANWVTKVTKGIKGCGKLRFKRQNKGMLISGKKTIDLAGKMKLMAPEWEARKRKTDTDQLGLQLAKAEALYFLHTGIGIDKGKRVGKYVFMYRDGTRVEEELVTGLNIGAREDTEDLDNARYVGEGFYVSRWTNPHPEKALSSIEVAVDSEKSKILVAGITGYLIREKLHD